MIKKKPLTLRELSEEFANTISIWDSLPVDAKTSDDFIDPDEPVRIVLHPDFLAVVEVVSVGGSDRHDGLELEAVIR